MRSGSQEGSEPGHRQQGAMDGWVDVFRKRETDDQARKDGWTFSEMDMSGTRRAGKSGREYVVGE